MDAQVTDPSEGGQGLENQTTKVDYPKPAIWISWHRSRRSASLARSLSLEFVSIQVEAWPPVRHLLSALWTVWQLLRYRPRTIFTQHSFLLTFILATYSLLSARGVVIVIDAHTKALKRDLPGVTGQIFRKIRAWSFKRATAVVVANQELVVPARQLSSSVLVIPDPLPALQRTKTSLDASAKPPYYVLVASYAEDEPWEDFLSAAWRIPQRTFYCTGKPTQRVLDGPPLPPNVRLTGYLSDIEYWTLLRQAEGIIALTRDEGCIQCAAVEALYVSQPLILSLTSVQQQVFGDAAVYVDHDLSNLECGIAQAERDRNKLGLASQDFCKRRALDVSQAVSRLGRLLEGAE